MYTVADCCMCTKHWYYPSKQSFRPLTVERPKVLLPLVGVPLVEYTLEWLVSSGVNEVRSEHVAGCQHLVHLPPLQQVPACRSWSSAAHTRSRCSST